MAILKHIASKSSNYGAALEYLIFKHDELRKTPILDQNGNRIMRNEFYLDGLNCEPYSFDAACQQLNREYQKNKNKDEIKSHHYIISFDPRDSAENCLTGKRAQELGLEYAKANFPGHQALVCTHMDGHNGSGNIHVHIVINSLRKLDVPQQPFMERPIDCKAGYKHHVTNDYPKFLLQMSLSHTARLTYVLLLDRMTLSQKNSWVDAQGRAYVLYPLAGLAADLQSSISSVTRALRELEAARLIERRSNGFSKPNQIFLGVPQTVQKCAIEMVKNEQPDCSKVSNTIAQNCTPNQINKNNLRLNKINRTKEAYGRYQNVFLENYSELKIEIAELDALIEDLSAYMQSTGKKYADHAATLRSWSARKKKQQKPGTGIPDYTYNEEESL